MRNAVWSLPNGSPSRRQGTADAGVAHPVDDRNTPRRRGPPTAGGTDRGLPRLTPSSAGTPYRSRRTAPRARFTPAAARTTTSGGLGSIPSTVHPRSGGDHLPVVDVLTSYYGSPPRWRGAPRVRGSPPGRHRLTPASAGTTVMRSLSRYLTAVHPRGGGDHVPSPKLSNLSDGSPLRR